MRSPSPRLWLLIAFTLSGFSGLIYESLWTQYLKLFLGHAAYAQTLVLAIFMGGLAVGAWLCSRLSHRWTNLLRGYAIVEAAIGLAALLFHPLFDWTVTVAYSDLIPALSSPMSVSVFKWTLGAALILPQSILLGTTFPLMAGGFIRAFPAGPGGSLGLLYFCNSIGAAAGVLTSGFFLIPRLGLPGTGAVAGVINLALAILVWRIAGTHQAARVVRAAPSTRALTASTANFLLPLMLATSLLTGLASFIYEIAWIRMLSLVLGSSTQSFELMLSAFILGLAFGGLWIKRRIDRLDEPVAFLGVVQVGMGALAAATLTMYEGTFAVMRWLLQTLPKTDLGYVGYNLASHGIAMGIMLPATFLAGSTLPLITFLLLRTGRGESSIGAVYSANTVGAIVGVILAVHIGLPILGLKYLILSGAAVDVALGVALLWIAGGQRRTAVLATVGGVVCLAVLAAGSELNLRLMASGVFRPNQQVLSASDLILFHRDGKTATIDVTEGALAQAIRTNGKIDASVAVNAAPPTNDEPTQVLSAALPLLMHPSARVAANIGLGSGVTSHVLLSVPTLDAVDTIEIERAMVEGAELFRPMNERTYSDPRSRVVIDDAKTFFSTYQRRYDIIVSEPSNPWVSGTASLFSTEFYELIRRHMAPGALFVQWLQLYEFDLSLVASVLKALGQNFEDYAIYLPAQGDVLIIAVDRGAVPEPRDGLGTHPQLEAHLRRIGVQSLQDITVRKIGDKQLLDPWVRRMPVPANSDFHPVLEHRAPRARFLNLDARMLMTGGVGPFPVLELLGGGATRWPSTQLAPVQERLVGSLPFVAMGIRDAAAPDSVATASPDVRRNGDKSGSAVAVELLRRCAAASTEEQRRSALYDLGFPAARFLGPSELNAVWARLETLPCGSALTQSGRDWLTVFRAVGRRAPREMAAAAEHMLKENLAADQRAYLIAVAMLGHLAAGDRDAAQAAWTRAQPVQTTPLFVFSLSVLTAHAFSEDAHQRAGTASPQIFPQLFAGVPAAVTFPLGRR